MGVAYSLIEKMVKENDHNKYTTLYYLLMKKVERGDLELADLRSPSPKSPKQHTDTQKTLEKFKKSQIKTIRTNTNRSSGRGSYYDSARQRSLNSQRKSTRARSRYSRNSGGSHSKELPEINQPNLTVNDITYEIKEKITINTSKTPSGNRTNPYAQKLYHSGRGGYHKALGDHNHGHGITM